MANNGCTVLVTGGAGYLGSHVVLELLEAHYPVVVLDDLSSGQRGMVDRRARFFEGKIENESLLRSIMETHGIDAVIHCAGAASVAEAASNPLKYYRTNALATRSLLESALACGIGQIIYTSSAAVYGHQPQGQIAEAAKLAPISAYGRSMLVAEMMIRDTATTGAINYAIIRAFNVAGADPDGRCGPLSSSHPGLLKAALESILGKRPPLHIHGANHETADGTCLRDFVHVSDVAKAHVLTLNRMRQASGGNMIVNCGSGSAHSVRQVLDIVQKTTNVRTTTMVGEALGEDPPSLVASIRSIRELTGWQPEHTQLEHIVRSAFNWELRLPRPAPVLAANSLDRNISKGSAAPQPVRREKTMRSKAQDVAVERNIYTNRA